MAVAKFLWEPHATGTARSLLPAVSPAPGERNASRRFFDFHQQQQARQFTSAACRARAAYASSEPRGGCSKRRRSFATLAFSLSLRAQAMNSGTEAALAQCANRFVHVSALFFCCCCFNPPRHTLFNINILIHFLVSSTQTHTRTHTHTHIVKQVWYISNS